MTHVYSDILRDIDTYYSAKIREHGPSSRGVDWNSEEGQMVRFAQLMKIVVGNDEFSINDLGCGYGALLSFLQRGFAGYSYRGIDVSQDMIRVARAQYGESDRITFEVSSSIRSEADYAVASGVFNVKLKHDEEEWWSYVTSTLDMMDATSRKGFAFNCLTKYSDSERMRDDLFYADPCRMFDWCKRKYSRQVALLHDYGLYEFTILVRK